MSDEQDPRSTGDDWCVHYCGLGGRSRTMSAWVDAECDAGIRYIDVRQDREGAKTSLDQLPCFASNHLPCQKQQFRTPEENEARHRATAEAIKNYFNDIAERRCPQCKATIVKDVQVGCCVYAEPCGHRLYQGQLADS